MTGYWWFEGNKRNFSNGTSDKIMMRWRDLAIIG